MIGWKLGWKRVMNRVGDNKRRGRRDGMGEILVEDAIKVHRECMGEAQSGTVRKV